METHRGVNQRAGFRQPHRLPAGPLVESRHEDADQPRLLGALEDGFAQVGSAKLRQEGEKLIQTIAGIPDLALAGIDSRDRAEQLVGQEVLGDRRRFPPLPPGEYYWFQLLGLPVYDAGNGALLGHLQEILPTPGHDVYVVVEGRREVLFPAVEEVIVEINLAEGFIRVAPPQGLLEAYAD